MSSFSHWYNSNFHTQHAPRPPWRIHNPRAQPRPPRASFFPGSPSPSSRVTWLGAEVSYGVKASKPGYSITPPGPNPTGSVSRASLILRSKVISEIRSLNLGAATVLVTRGGNGKLVQISNAMDVLNNGINQNIWHPNLVIEMNWSNIELHNLCTTG